MLPPNTVQTEWVSRYQPKIWQRLQKNWRCQWHQWHSLLECMIFDCTQNIGLQSRCPTFPVCTGKGLFQAKIHDKETCFCHHPAVCQDYPYVISEKMWDAKRRENMELIHRSCQTNHNLSATIVCLASECLGILRQENQPNCEEHLTPNNSSSSSLLAPTGTLIVIVVYYTTSAAAAGHFLRFRAFLPIY